MIKTNIQKIEPYPIRLVIVATDSIKDLKDWSKDNGVLYPDDWINEYKDDSEVVGFCGQINLKGKAAIITVVNPEEVDEGIIAHEALHVLGYVFEYINQDMVHQHESQNYLMQWAIREINLTIKL